VPSGNGLNRFRARFFLAAVLLGGTAGVLAGMARGEYRALLALSVAGPLLLFLGGGAGGVAGMLLAAARERWRGRRFEPSPDAADATMLLGVFGALLGLVAAVFAGAHGMAHWWTAAGAFLGGLAESLSGRVAAVLLHLTVLDELSDEERARERRPADRDPELERFLDDSGPGPRPPDGQ